MAITSETTKAATTMGASTAGQPVTVTLQLPPEHHDYGGDLVSGGIGLAGALIGAYAAYRFGTVAARKAKAAADRERDLFLMFSLLHKTQRIYSTQLIILSHIQDGQAYLREQKRAAKKAGQPELFQTLALAVRPSTNRFDRISFTPEEIVCASKFLPNNPINDLMILDDHHNTTLNQLEAYRIDKEEFERVAHRGAKFRDGVMSFAWTKEQYTAIEPLLWKADNSLAQLLGSIMTDVPKVYATLVEIIQARAKLKGGSMKYGVKAPDGRTMIVTAEGVVPGPEGATPEDVVKGKPQAISV